MEPIGRTTINCAHIRNFKSIVAQKEPHGKTIKVGFLVIRLLYFQIRQFSVPARWISVCVHSIILLWTNVSGGE